ncbi:MAG TPA: phospholipase D-like domain-containing protein, partial [Blastocatellia bacterium]|nr:phospholipase D-like domain-containing protein [Blastocatellia bacterium]
MTVTTIMKRFACLTSFLMGFLLLVSQPVSAQERLCDTSFEDCREPLWRLIDQETVGLDVAFWFMQDTSFANKIIARHNAGVPVRILVDPRANPTYSGNEAILNQLAAAGIPMRKNVAGGILHWKMMLFAGQNTVEFSGANYSAHFFTPTQPFTNYVDEAIYFTSDPSIVNSFRTKYDDLWTNTAQYATYANITGPLTRRYSVFPIDPELDFPPRSGGEEYANRAVAAYNAEAQKIDVIMYRITDRRHTDAMIAAKNRGIPVRLLTEPFEYRNPDRLWVSWNVDRLYAAGIEIKWRKQSRLGLNHEKVVMLYGQGLTIFGSSNWTSPSSNSQEEHNYFTHKTWFFDWFVNHFERKWNSETENEPFTPLPPDVPIIRTPVDGASAQPTTNMLLKWEGGRYAHKYDVYFGTNPNPPLVTTDYTVHIDAVNPGIDETYQLPTLLPGTTYYWRIVGKTMANVTASGPVWSFTTAGTPPPPTNPPTITGIMPNSGSINGGTTVEITGTNFAAGATVTFAGLPATNITVVSNTTITAKTPAHAEGAVDVVVKNSNNLSGTLAGGFTYANTPPPPPPTEGEVVLYAAEAPVKVGGWTVVADPVAAGGSRLHLPDAGRPKVADAVANPGQYFDMTFEAQSGRAYRLWIRGKAQNDFYGNDSVLVQFSDSVDQGGAPVWRIGAAGGDGINLEDCSGCGLSGWGWQDNGWGVGVFGQVVYFATTGTHTIRIQNREDGLSIDQIVL